MRSSGRTEGALSRTMDRGEFLKVGGGLAGGAALLGVAPATYARVEVSSSLEHEFNRAAQRYRIPVELLLAMGYVNTHWEMPPASLCSYRKGDPERRGAFGIMALVQNPGANTLGTASKLTGIPEHRLKTDRFSNILGGAALLASSQGSARPATLAGWYGAVSGRGGHGPKYEAVSGVGGGDLYAAQVLQTLRKGASRRTSGGERIVLRAREIS